MPSKTLRQRATWLAHLYKATAKQYHREAAHFLRPLIPANGVVIDVGAHSGQFAKLFAVLVPQGRVYAFEPSPYALSILKPTLNLKRLSNVTIVESGLSAEEGRETLHIPIKKRGTLGFGLAHLGADVSGRAVQSYSIALTTLDKFAAENNLTRLDFLKADIEGWELHMLKGGIETIHRLRPSLLLEISPHQLARAGATPEDIFTTLLPRGYVAYFTDEHAGYALWPAASFNKIGDYLFVPSEKSSLLQLLANAA
jgi:FkbM family methyltransferase